MWRLILVYHINQTHVPSGHHNAQWLHVVWNGCDAQDVGPCICPASAVANAVSCVCPAGWSQLHHSTPGRWQCVPAADNAVDKEMPDWGINIIVVCVLVAVSSLGFAVWGAKSALASATPAFPAEFAPPRVTQGAGLREGLVNRE